MKLMINGALTIGTRDGANIEMAAAAGEENFFLFGLGVFAPILDVLIRKGDHYLHLADLKSYSEAHTRLGELYADQENWSRKAVLNIAASSTFSSDRTIAEYARDIWHAEPCPVQ
jgi:glycogen phosphorylase